MVPCGTFRGVGKFWLIIVPFGYRLLSEFIPRFESASPSREDQGPWRESRSCVDLFVGFLVAILAVTLASFATRCPIIALFEVVGSLKGQFEFLYMGWEDFLQVE